MSETKNDIAWNKLFSKYKISEEVLKNGSFEINSSQINQFREARLKTKFDFRSQLPEIFSENKLSILPISRGGYIISDLAYITDANFISDKEKKKLFGIGTLIINCLQMDKHISHFNLEECLELIDLVKPKKTYLTHISHNLGLHKVIQKNLPQNVYLSYDGLKINF